MKLKSAILTSALVLSATAANASDITSPFYLPSEGKFLSETSLEYNRIRRTETHRDFVGEQTTLTEKLTYGITDNLSAYASVTNYFDTQRYYNNDHNFTYTVGGAYNFSKGNMLGQVGVEYFTSDPEEYMPYVRSSNWEKDLNFNLKLGYKASSGYIPYIDISGLYELNRVDQFRNKESDWIYSTFAGVHKMFTKTSMDLGVRWINDRSAPTGLPSSDSVLAEGKYNYFISDTMTVGVYGSYLVGDTEMGRTDYAYSAGVNLKVAF